MIEDPTVIDHAALVSFYSEAQTLSISGWFISLARHLSSCSGFETGSLPPLEPISCQRMPLCLRRERATGRRA